MLLAHNMENALLSIGVTDVSLTDLSDPKTGSIDSGSKFPLSMQNKVFII